MRNLLTSLIISFAVIAIASPSFAGDDRGYREWDRDKKEQRHHDKKDKKHHGNPFKKIMGQLDDLNDKLDELLAKGVDLRGVTQNWDKKLDSTNGDANGCNSDRFTCLWPTVDHPNGTAVRDNETGAVWERSPMFTDIEWTPAIRHCATREVGGRKGWSLPTREQLASLVDTSNSDPALPANHPFENVQPVRYWSTTTLVDVPANAWGVRFGDGLVFQDGKTSLFTYHAWCVRGGQTYDGQDVLQVLEALPD